MIFPRIPPEPSNDRSLGAISVVGWGVVPVITRTDHNGPQLRLNKNLGHALVGDRMYVPDTKLRTFASIGSKALPVVWLLFGTPAAGALGAAVLFTHIKVDEVNLDFKPKAWFGFLDKVRGNDGEYPEPKASPAPRQEPSTAAAAAAPQLGSVQSSRVRKPQNEKEAFVVNLRDLDPAPSGSSESMKGNDALNMLGRRLDPIKEIAYGKPRPAVKDETSEMIRQTFDPLGSLKDIAAPKRPGGTHIQVSSNLTRYVVFLLSHSFPLMCNIVIPN
eukprot:1394996-Amorphochlora_amoeboformis.AAC.3